MKKILLFILLLISKPSVATEGKFINPLTDVCWECMFPITISGVNVTPQYSESTKYNKPVCLSYGVPGIPLTFWEPSRLVDVTRHSYKLLGLGGISIGDENIKNRGTTSVDNTGQRSSFYHVHWYFYPLLSLMNLFSDFLCVTGGDIGVAYLTEFDPLWNNESLSFILNAEAAIFSNPIAQLACVSDCGAANFNKNLDKLFWCGGCQGSLYPFTGKVSHHTGAIQASSLLVHRMIAKLHRIGFVKGYQKYNFGKPSYMPLIKKSLYKTQLVYPVAQIKGPCHALGKSDMVWGAGKSFPIGGEDFVYLVWKKKQCCLDALKIATGGAL